MRQILYLAVLLLSSLDAFAGPDWVVVEAGERWTKLSRYLMAKITFIVVCEPGRRCEAGSGYFTWGKPRGSKRKFEGRIRMTAYGAGSLRVRADDGKGKVRVAFYEEGHELIPIYPPPWESFIGKG